MEFTKGVKTKVQEYNMSIHYYLIIIKGQRDSTYRSDVRRILVL